MSDKMWCGGGIYSKTPRRGPCRGEPIYYGRAWVPSRRKQIAFWLGPGKLLDVRRRLAAIVADPERALAERSRKRVQGIVFGRVLDLFLEDYRPRSGRTTYYREATAAARAFFGETPVAEIAVPDVDRYLARRRAKLTVGRARVVNDETVMVGAGRRKVSESSLRKECIALGTVFKWAERRGLVARNPIARVERPKEPRPPAVAVLDRDQEVALLAALPPWARDVVEWGVYSGMRRSEILALSWRNIDRAGGVAHVVSGKTGKARAVPLALSTRLTALLDRQPRHVGSDLVFCERDGSRLDVRELDAVVQAAMRTAGVPKTRGVTWNLFRKTWVSRLYASGRVLPQDESDWAGHSVQIAMRHYRDYSPASLERAAGALDGPVAAPPGQQDEDAGIGTRAGTQTGGAA